MPRLSLPEIASLSLVALLLVFAGAGMHGCIGQQHSSEEFQKLQTVLEGVKSELTDLRQGVPKEMEQRLKDLDSVLNDPKRWPQKPDDAEKLRKDLDGIVRTLPPFAAERILPQLVRLNWGVEALWNLRTYAEADPCQLEDVQATFNETLDRYPQGHYKELQKELTGRLEELRPRLRQVHLKQLLERANHALKAPEEDASAAYSSLDEYRGDKEVDAILPKLRTKIMEKAGTERVAGFEKTLKQTLLLVDLRFRQISMLNIQEGLLRLITDLQLDEAAPKEVTQKAEKLLAQCDQELLALARGQQEVNVQKHRRYQEWALGQIQKFDSRQGWYYDVTLPWVEKELRKFGSANEDVDWELFKVFPSTTKLVAEKLNVDLTGIKGSLIPVATQKEIYANIGGVTWTKSINTELAYRATRDGMVKFLLPIQSNLLDPPVAQLYQQAFSKGWQKLEGRDDQLFVAEQSALERFTIALHTDNGHGTSRECRVA